MFENMFFSSYMSENIDVEELKHDLEKEKYLKDFFHTQKAISFNLKK